MTATASTLCETPGCPTEVFIPGLCHAHLAQATADAMAACTGSVRVTVTDGETVAVGTQETVAAARAEETRRVEAVNALDGKIATVHLVTHDALGFDVDETLTGRISVPFGDAEAFGIMVETAPDTGLSMRLVEIASIVEVPAVETLATSAQHDAAVALEKAVAAFLAATSTANLSRQRVEEVAAVGSLARSWAAWPTFSDARTAASAL